jgi:hypothetical protein
LEVIYELERQHQSKQKLDQSKQDLVELMNSRSWRVTAPLRWVAAWHRTLVRRMKNTITVKHSTWIAANVAKAAGVVEGEKPAGE